MSAQYPPSSPIASFRYDENDPFYQPAEKESIATLNFFKKKVGVSNHVAQYPTPNPSSTLGVSSPLKTGDKLASSSQTPSECEFEQELRQEIDSSRSLRLTRSLDIPLDSRVETRVSVGRKNNLCDVVLPRHKNVSRLHAFVTYSPTTKQVKVECKGTNGLIVVFPVKLNLKLAVSAQYSNTYRLVDESCSEITLATKEVVRDTNLTSFVVLQGETVYMPYVEDTKIDFRQIECKLVLKEFPEDHYDDLHNETETEDELQALNITSDDFPQEPLTPPRKMVPVSQSLKPSWQPNHSETKQDVAAQTTHTNLEITEKRNGNSNETPTGHAREAKNDEFVAAATNASTEKSIATAASSVPPIKETEMSKLEGSQETPKLAKKSLKTLKSAKDLNAQPVHQSQPNDATKAKTNNCTAPFQKKHITVTPELHQTPQKQKDSSRNSQETTPHNEAHKNLRRRKYTSPSPKKNHKRKNKPQQPTFSSESVILQMESRGVATLDLQHVLANHLAFSNVQQVPFSQLQDVNSTISKLKPFELRALLKAEKCIGVIYREGKDAAGKPLDEEYYYDLENDSDNNRRQLVSSLKGGRTGLRNCRKVHKQYFWKKPT
ncbi:LAFA_0G01750g1_1 [Lachancea sp. 'fantastica']|nr:LAFA_0G01750g1_1 [Lachancea sp. 'fantastica']